MINMREPSGRRLAAAAVIGLAALGVLLFRGNSGSTRNEQAYYMDAQTLDLFAADVLPAPIASPTGGEGVRAYVFTCGACDVDQWAVAYVEKFTPDARAAMLEPTAVERSREESEALVQRMEEGRLVAGVGAGESMQWEKASSAAGIAIRQRATQRCDDGSVRLPCQP